MGTVSAKKTNVSSTASINCHSKKVRDCYVLHSFISNHITIDNYYYLLLLCKIKRNNIKWNIMNLKSFILKIIRIIILMK